MRYKRMTGEKIYLMALISDDAETITRWLNDPKVTQYRSEHREIKSLELVKEEVEEHIKTGAAFAVFDKDAGTMIGTCVLDGDGIELLMGNQVYWSNGCAAEAICFLLDFGFNLRNCGSISVSAYSHDTGAITLFEEIGFVKTVVQRERLLRGRDKYDRIFFDMLASEYFKKEKINA